MDAVYAILIAVALIIVLIAVFTLLTYLFLNHMRRPSGQQAAKAFQKQGKR